MNNDLKKENELKSKKSSLTHEEWMTFFFLPFFAPKPRGRDDHFSESEINRFKSYGFDNKIKEAIKTKKQGYVFWFVIILIALFIFK